METSTKEILNDYGYENWTSQAGPDDYKISKEKLAKTHKAILEKRKNNLARDVAAYDVLTDSANLPKKPPGI